MPMKDLPPDIHRRILSFLPWQSHLPASKACQFWAKLLREDQFRIKRYSGPDESGVLTHVFLSSSCIGFAAFFGDVGPNKSMAEIQFYTTEFAKKVEKSKMLRAMQKSLLAGPTNTTGGILDDPLFVQVVYQTEEEAKELAKRRALAATKRSKLKRVPKKTKSTFFNEKNSVSTRFPMSLRIGLLNYFDPIEQASDLVNVNLAEGSPNRKLTVRELLRGIAEAAAADYLGSQKLILVEFEMWRWLPNHYFGTLKPRKPRLTSQYQLLRAVHPMIQPGWRGKRARFTWKMRRLFEKAMDLPGLRTRIKTQKEKDEEKELDEKLEWLMKKHKKTPVFL
ncbi:hypothetical protein TWF481_003094 [Arthrobotrys musiformis]|uniref:F-box domain-containing protein n=1 Tax=Arthrobotrys musiformis TaxID=47236 RepID=A0AAV9VS97_9PEZI